MRWLAGLSAMLILALLAGCASSPQRANAGRYSQQYDTTPSGSIPNVYNIPEPVPRPEPRSRYGNKSSYTVNGRTYYVLRTARGYVQRGTASWYGTKFQGHLTSSLERYDMYKYSAASKVLPLPSFALVTNLANGKSVVVRINDRGPFVSGRIIDLSYVAALRIGIWRHGTGRVEVQGIDPDDPHWRSDLTGGYVAGSVQGPLYVQVGSFEDRHNAKRLHDRLDRAGLQNVSTHSVMVRGQRFYRVRLGPLPNAATARRVLVRVHALGLYSAQILSGS
ncbi:MAG TPA: septal ring lytic transglycosylase RlpA family protein [Mizugakiibacter sp.]|nr:septal ring lytic transglycosylase RlpA family protein [Mizugakiibacter sp.]